LIEIIKFNKISYCCFSQRSFNNLGFYTSSQASVKNVLSCRHIDVDATPTSPSLLCQVCHRQKKKKKKFSSRVKGDLIDIYPNFISEYLLLHLKPDVQGPTEQLMMLEVVDGPSVQDIQSVFFILF
jgi:hypothetical protein